MDIIRCQKKVSGGELSCKADIGLCGGVRDLLGTYICRFFKIQKFQDFVLGRYLGGDTSDYQNPLRTLIIFDLISVHFFGKMLLSNVGCRVRQHTEGS